MSRGRAISRPGTLAERMPGIWAVFRFLVSDDFNSVEREMGSRKEYVQKVFYQGDF